MPTMLITGGAGFIGVNSALYFARNGWQVIVLDNLSRRGSAENLAWLQNEAAVAFERADIRDRSAVDRIVNQVKPEVLLHLAAQVAVTTSVQAPWEDFATNALGTINILEAIRLLSPETFFINASTNKVYGGIHHAEVIEQNGRYAFRDHPEGIDEKQSLDLLTPYGCSKGTADHYTSEYSRSFGLKTVTFRQSCIYGPRQFGQNDQGWVAWFTIAALFDKQITVFGDGKQSRDVLWVNDLVRAYELAISNRELISGQIFNIGGGEGNSISLLELIAQLENLLGKQITIIRKEWRSGDQRVFSSNTAKAKQKLGWEPRVSVEEGLKSLVCWARETKALHSLYNDISE